MKRLARRVPRGAAAAIVFVTLLVVGIGVIVLVLAGVLSHTEALQGNLQGAVDKLQSRLQDVGASSDTATKAGDGASSGLSSAFHALVTGLGHGISALASLAVFLSFTALSLFFLLKDGPVIRSWTERHMGLPTSVARSITHRTIQSLRGYFVGVTAVAANADELDRPQGWDVVIDATGNEKAIQDGIGRVAKGGTFLQFGVSDYSARVTIEPYKIYNQEITITGSMAVLHSFERAADLFATGVLDPEIFISDRVPLDGYAKALDQFKAGVGRKIQVLP
jgi:hypothetical protein